MHANECVKVWSVLSHADLAMVKSLLEEHAIPYYTSNEFPVAAGHYRMDVFVRQSDQDNVMSLLSASVKQDGSGGQPSDESMTDLHPRWRIIRRIAAYLLLAIIVVPLVGLLCMLTGILR